MTTTKTETGSSAEDGEPAKPVVRLSGQDSNTMNLASICGLALRKAGQAERAKEMYRRITDEAEDSDHALRIMMEYCDVE